MTEETAITLTGAAAHAILAALSVSLDNYELDLLNDDEGEFAAPAWQVQQAHNLLASMLGEEKRTDVEEPEQYGCNECDFTTNDEHMIVFADAGMFCHECYARLKAEDDGTAII